MKIVQVMAAPLVALVVLALGCKNNPANPTTAAVPPGFYVVNEGLFAQSNAELSYVTFDDGSVTPNVFSSFNGGRTLGDVANHMVIYNGFGYIVVNNSGKVEVINVQNHKSAGTIFLSGKPRQLAIINIGKAYVTNMDSTLSVINLSSLLEVKKIKVGLFPEGVVSLGAKAYVANGGFGSGRTISVINTASDSVYRTIAAPDGPSYIALAPNGKIYVSCTGYSPYPPNPSAETNGRIISIDPNTDTIVDTMTVTGHPGKLGISSDGFLYVIGPEGNPVWKFSAQQGLTLLSQNFIAGSFYGLGVDPVTGDVYVGDANNFSGNGKVSIYSSSGSRKADLTKGIGIAPNGFAFNR